MLSREMLRSSLNGRMLLDGYATVFIMEELSFEDELYRMQREAMDARRGLWGMEGWPAYAALWQTGG